MRPPTHIARALGRRKQSVAPLLWACTMKWNTLRRPAAPTSPTETCPTARLQTPRLQEPRQCAAAAKASRPSSTRPRPRHLDLANVHRNDSGKLPTPSKSPRSFRSSFLLSSRDGRNTQMRPNQGHEKLTSAESSPRLARREVSKSVVKKELGKNHEYFSGNTAFCWGGRLQNTRDRPVNLATAIMIILPACLFFGYSCVYPILAQNSFCLTRIYRAPWLWRNVSPSIPILFAYLFLVSVSSFLHASASDPGVSYALPCTKLSLT
jgi:hypothetical protein